MIRPIHESVDVHAVTDAVESGEYIGFCIACGQEHTEVEPDARDYECEFCGDKAVFGAQELLFTLFL